MKIITINTDTRKFFKQYLSIIRPLLVPRLSDGELNIIAELLYFNHLYRDIAPSKRGKLVFDYDNKISILDNLDTSMSTLDNTLTSLRKKGYIKGKRFRQDLLIDPKDTFKLGFVFNMKDE